MSVGKALCLVLCFFLDVHVRAEEAIGAAHGRKIIQRENLKVVLDKGALVEVRGSGFHLVRGFFLVEAQLATRFSTPFATLWCENNSKCKALFERTSDHLSVKSLAGEWRFTRNGDAQIYSLPLAMQMRFAEVTDEGVASMDFPQSLPWLSTLKVWGRLFVGKPDEFKAQVSEFRAVWKAAVETASQLHAQGAARTIASAEAEASKREATRRQDERETNELRRQMRERNYLTP